MRLILLIALAVSARASTHAELVQYFKDWRDFQRPRMVNGVPNYSPAAMCGKQLALKGWQQKLATFDMKGWSVAEKVDYNLVRAEMNGLDFDLRVLRPWSRNPFFYATLFAQESDTPLHEGPHVYDRRESELNRGQ